MRKETAELAKAAAEARAVVQKRVLGELGEDAKEARAELETLEKADAALAKAFEAEAAEAEKREDDAPFVDLQGRIECRAYLNAAASDGKLEGAEAEFNKELGLADNQMPYAALLDDEDRAEMRADVPTTVVDSAKHKPRMSVLTRVFRRTDAAFCGIRMPTAPRGLPVYPVMTAGVAGDTKAEGAAIEAEAATFTATMITPTRATARYLVSVEQLAQFADLESILRADLRMAMGKLADDLVVSEDATSPNPGSIISHADASGVTNPGAIATLKDFDDAYADGIDGLYAYSREGVRLLTGIETERFLVTKRHDETASTFGAMVSAAGGMRRPTTRVAAAVTNVQKAYRIVPEELRAIMPVWEGLEMIRDPYTGAAKGQIAITALMLFGFDIIRGTVKELRFKLA